MDSDGSSHNLNILFVCMGNACRSPMADFYFKDLVQKAGFNNSIKVSSAAVSDNPLEKDFCIGTKKELDKWLIPYHKRAPVKLTKEDCKKYDYIICMDTQIEELVIKFGGSKIKNKVYRLLDFSDTPMDILDPAETNDFVRTFKEVSKGCDALLKYLTSKKNVQIKKLISVA